MVAHVALSTEAHRCRLGAAPRLLAVFLITAIACSPSATRVVSRHGQALEWISMTQDEAVLVDQLVAQEPADDSARCSYWKRNLASIPQSEKQATEYVDKKTNSVCETPPGSAQSGAPQPTRQSRSAQRTVNHPSTTGPYSGTLTLEDDGENWTNIVITLRKNDKPVKVSFGLRTQPGWDHPTQALTASTDASGVARISSADTRTKIFGWYERKSQKTSVPTFGILVDGQWISIQNALAPLYASWALADWESRKTIGVDEINAGKCRSERAQILQEATVGLKGLFDAMSTGGDVFRLVNSRIVVATNEGTAAETDPGGGEIHMFAIGFDPVSLEIRNNGYPVQTKSPFEIPVRSSTQGNTDSRVMQVNWGDPLPTKVVGNGCALVVVVHKL